MAGTSILRPRSKQLVENAFTQIAILLGAGDRSPEEQLHVLLTTPAEPFVETVGRKFNLGPIVDGDIIPAMTSYEALTSREKVLELFPGLQKCRSIMIGDCEFDVSVPYRVCNPEHQLINAVSGRDLGHATRFAIRCLSTYTEQVPIAKFRSSRSAAYGIHPYWLQHRPFRTIKHFPHL